jgi:hypothetical protein
VRKPISPAPSDAQAKTAGKGIGQYTGAPSQDSQNEEGYRIVGMLFTPWCLEQMSDWERDFISDLAANTNRPITGKMLFKLRDIKDRYL